MKQVEEKIWLVSFMRYDLGFFDHETCRIESAENPFAAKLLPMSPAPFAAGCIRVHSAGVVRQECRQSTSRRRAVTSPSQRVATLCYRCHVSRL